MSAPSLDVTGNPTKAQSNLATHDVSFAQAATVLLDPLALTVFDAEHSQDRSWFTLGAGSDGKLLSVSHTLLGEQPSRSEGANHFRTGSDPARAAAVSGRTQVGKYHQPDHAPRRRHARGD